MAARSTPITVHKEKMQAVKVYPTWLFWTLVFTFAWGLLVAPLGVKKFIGWSECSTLFGYPIVCWSAAILLARAKRSGSTIFAGVHVVFGAVWIVFVLWVFDGFARTFRK
jgi:hypothetical protein